MMTTAMISLCAVIASIAMVRCVAMIVARVAINKRCMGITGTMIAAMGVCLTMARFFRVKRAVPEFVRPIADKIAIENNARQ